MFLHVMKLNVVYFDQRMGAPHAVRWLKYTTVDLSLEVLPKKHGSLGMLHNKTLVKCFIPGKNNFFSFSVVKTCF